MVLALFSFIGFLILAKSVEEFHKFGFKFVTLSYCGACYSHWLWCKLGSIVNGLEGICELTPKKK